jgi:hypothetical protein
MDEDDVVKIHQTSQEYPLCFLGGYGGEMVKFQTNNDV